ncbi:sugar ABC transporter substrate-binding protein [Lachnospiraceae bacterium ASD3451]|uniref:sugar ABC transporter substrate-binding protein n=1 Tax=Diplocloster agilis TaxID=2850323 RepID=UPI001DA07583|nr:sugar ABC transporter substrate-binding protein [Diplocloster agilis]MBU9744624.1 sugar ABC transporter substrate-binding protein [Diplocloster agilis]
MRKLLSVICMVSLCATVITGCSSKNESAETATSDQNTSAPAAESDSAEKDTGKDGGGYVIGYASKSSTTPFWVQLNAAIQSAAADAQVTVKEIGPAKENDVAGQISVIEDFLTQDVDALIVAPCDDVGVAPAVQKFIDAGKPVIAVDNGVTGVDITALVATDNKASAGAAAAYIAEKLGDDAKVVTIDGVVAQGTGKDRKNGFVDTLKEKAPNAEVVSSIAADWVDDTALKGVEDLINGNVEFNAIFAAWDGGALAAYQACKSAGREDVMIVGHDAFEQSCDLMIAEDPIFQGSVAQNPSNMGSLAVQTAVKALSGETVEAFNDSGYQVVTGENAAEYKETNYSK